MREVKPQIILYVGIRDLKRMEENKEFYAYSKQGNDAEFQIILPTRGIQKIEHLSSSAGSQFLFNEQRLWELSFWEASDI